MVGKRTSRMPLWVVTSGSEVGAAIDGDVVSQFDQTLADFFVIGLNAAVFRNHAAPADEGHAQSLWQLEQRGLPRFVCCRTHPLVELHQFLIVSCRGVVCGHELPAGNSHLLHLLRPLRQIGNGSAQLLHIAGGVKQSGLTLAHQFAARTQIRGHHRTLPGIGLQNAFAQGFIGKGRQNREARGCDPAVPSLCRSSGR